MTWLIILVQNVNLLNWIESLYLVYSMQMTLFYCQNQLNVYKNLWIY
jgi:hypothetical protein